MLFKKTFINKKKYIYQHPRAPVYAIQTNHEHVEVRNTSGWEENFLKHNINIKLNIHPFVSFFAFSDWVHIRSCCHVIKPFASRTMLLEDNAPRGQFQVSRLNPRGSSGPRAGVKPPQAVLERGSSPLSPPQVLLEARQGVLKKM
jgi:hypothetical protein